MEAHVMTYDEILTAAENNVVVWEEIRKYETLRPLRFNGNEFIGLTGNPYLLIAECNEEFCYDYNWEYRLWNNMPTAKQRQDAPWKEDPYKGVE